MKPISEVALGVPALLSTDRELPIIGSSENINVTVRSSLSQLTPIVCSDGDVSEPLVAQHVQRDAASRVAEVV